MEHQELTKKVAQLESLYDHLTTEYEQLNELLKSVGFPNGVQSVKEVANEILETGELD